MNRTKNQIAEIKQVNCLRKVAKKDVKMQESPTISFGINTEPQISGAESQPATMLMKRKEVAQIFRVKDSLKIGDFASENVNIWIDSGHGASRVDLLRRCFKSVR